MVTLLIKYQMKKLFTLILLFISIGLMAQDTPPTGVDFKTLPTYSFKYYTADSTVWMYKGTTYGWTELARNNANYWTLISTVIGNDTTFVIVHNRDTVNGSIYKLKDDSLKYFRLLNNHDSLLTLDEKSYNSLTDKPDMSIYAPINSPTFTGTVTIPSPFNLGVTSVLPSGIELNYVDGVTSAIQTQLNARLPLAGGTMTGDILNSAAFDDDIGSMTYPWDNIYADNYYTRGNTNSGSHSKGLRFYNYTGDATQGQFGALYTDGDLVYQYIGMGYNDSNIKTYPNAGVLLEHNNSTKLSTSSTGVTVTGTTTTTGLKITTGATSGYYWKCNNIDGTGEWASSTGAQTYKGTWNATTNSPTLADGSGTTGWYYRCVTAGTVDFGSGNITFAVGDDAYYNGSVWQKIPGVGYSLQIASASVLGGVKIGDGVSIDGSGVISVSTDYEASGAVTTHESTYDHTHIAHGETAYGWGDPSGLYLPLTGGDITGDVTISGKLGIGSTAPAKSLSFGNSIDRRIFVEPTATDVAGKYLMVESGSTIAGTSTPDVNGGVLYLRAGVGTGTGTSRIYFQTGTKLTTGTTLQTVATKMALTGEGYLGLGNTSPTAKLHIDNSTAWNTATAPSFLVQSYKPDILMYDDNSSSGAEVRSLMNNNGVFSIGRAAYISDDYGYDEREIDLNISASGNFGIGTTSSASKLAINGGLHVGGTTDAGDNNILADGTITATSLVYANGGNSVEWNDAYDHALIAAGTGVHISDAERTLWNAKQAAITFGIANTNAVKIDMTGVADNDYAKFTSTGLEGRSYSEVLSDIGAAAINQSFYIGTTSVAINRASAGLTLAGITLTSPVLGTPASGTLTNCTNAHWDDAYSHSIIPGGTGVHISDGERISWNAKQSATLSNGKILVGNASNVATAVTMTGDVTITNAGVSAIGAGKVTNTMVATGIDAVKLANGTVTNSELQYINSVTSDVQTQINGKQPQLNGTGFVKASGTSISYVTDNSTNWNAAYNHSVDNTQAHSDYLLNNTNDITSGTLTAVNFILSSDRRLKENISYIKNLHKFDVDFVQFNLKSDPGQLRYGVIAQDLERVAPELVRTDSEGMKSVAYIDLLIVKIAQLEQRVKELEKAEQKHIKRDWWFYKKIKNEK